MERLANLKTEADKLDTDKLKTVPIDLSKLSKLYDNLVTKVNKSILVDLF